MKYWINPNSVDREVIILLEQSIVLASIDGLELDVVRADLDTGKNYQDILGTENYQIIVFGQLVKILSRSTDETLDLEYKAKGKIVDMFLDFASVDDKRAFMNELDLVLPSKLKKSENQQSALSASTGSIASLAAALCVSVFFINKFRWLTLVIGGIWVIASLYLLVIRIKKPPLITLWTTRNVIGNVWSKLKIVGICVFLMAVALGVSTRFPDKYGTHAFVEHLHHRDLHAENVETLVKNGGDINLLDDYGEGVIEYAVYEEDAELLKALLINGANPPMDKDKTSDLMHSIVASGQNIELLAALVSHTNEKIDLNKHMVDLVRSAPSEELVNHLYRVGLDKEATDEDGNNALQVALINYRDEQIISALIENGVRTDVLIDGKTLSVYASENEMSGAASMLAADNIDFDRQREITKFLNVHYNKQVRLWIKNQSPLVKLFLADFTGEDSEVDDIREEMGDLLQRKTMIAWSNAEIYRSYSEVCAEHGFDQASELNLYANRYLDAHSREVEMGELLIERNHSFYDERKGESVAPQQIKDRVSNVLAKFKKDYSEQNEFDKGTLIEKCAEMLKRFEKK